MNKLKITGQTNFVKYNFKATKEQNEILYTKKDIDEMYKKGEKTGFMNGAALTLLSAIICIGSFFTHKSTMHNEQEKFMKEVLNFYNTEDINKDSFIVQDTNNDGTPDILINSKNKKSTFLIDFQKASIKEITQKEKKALNLK